MREYLEILIYRYKKQNNLDIYSELNTRQVNELAGKIKSELARINCICEIKNMIGG